MAQQSPTTVEPEQGDYRMSSQEDIELTNIESELTRLWASQDGAGSIKACLFNLIIYSQDQRRLEHVQQLVKMVLERFPCRIIFIHGDAEATGDRLRTSVSADTTTKGGVTIGCDRITIEAAGKPLSRVPFIILPHIVPDLPVYLLWGQDPTRDCEILPHLERFATRFIFDSDCTDDLSRFSSHLLARLGHGRRETIDLTWARLRGWRDVMTQVFDTPDAILQLASSRVIEIEYNSHGCERCEHDDFQALYFQAWIGSRLTWKPTGVEVTEGQRRITYTNGLQQVTVLLKPTKCANLPTGVLVSVDVKTSNKHHYGIRRQGDSRMVQVEISSEEVCELPATLALSSLDRGSQLMQETFYEPPGDHYRAMLQTLTQLPVS